MGVSEFIEIVGKSIDAIGVSVIAVGALISAAGAAVRLSRNEPAYRPFRQQLGSSILLGLEFLVAADIIRTVAVTPEPKTVAVLAGIVLIRTFLSFSLELEMTGRWPWQATKARHEPPSRPPTAEPVRLGRHSVPDQTVVAQPRPRSGVR